MITTKRRWSSGHVRNCKRFKHNQTANVNACTKPSEQCFRDCTDTPGPVKAPVVSNIDSRSCDLSWESPNDNDGAVRILRSGLRFHVEQMRKNSYGWVKISETTTTSYHVTGLLKGFTYKFRIIAENKNGVGCHGEESREVEAVEPSGAPNGKVEVYDITFQSCMVSWRPPKGNGGTPITGYTLEMKEQDEIRYVPAGHVEGNEYFHRITGLLDNQVYKFRVRAVNTVGAGRPCIPSDAITTEGCDISDSHSMAVIEMADLESWGMDRVRDSFQRGINGITMLVESIKPLRCSVTFRESQSVSADIRYFATQAYLHIKDASDKTQCLNDELDKRIENLMRKQGQKERKVKQKETEIAKLRGEVSGKKKELADEKVELDNVKRRYREAQNSLEKAEKELEKKKKEQATVAVVGAVITPIPIIGWIAGPTMIIVSLTALQKNVDAAKGMCNRATENLNKQNQRVNDKKADIDKFQHQLESIKSNKITLHATVRQLEQTIDNLRTQYAAQSHVSDRLKQCASFISIAAGRAEVLHDQVKFLYNLEAIVGPLTELVSHFDLPQTSQLCLPCDKEDIDLFVMKLKMIAQADDHWKPENGLDFRKDHKVFMATNKGKKIMAKVAAVEQASDKLHSDDDIREERNMMLSKYAGWEHFLIPAPMSIAFLGQLMLISTHKDFSLNKNLPLGGFKLLRNPMSFRASVLQVSNAGWNAFNTANTNMDRITGHLNTLPLHLKSAFDILISGSNEEVQQFLPQSMMAIKNVAEKCLQGATKTHDGFKHVMNMIAELQGACVSTEGNYETERQNARISLEVAKEEKRVIEEEKEQLNKQKEQLLRAIQEAEKQFSEAVTSLPSGGKVLGMAIAEGIVDGATVVLDAVTKPFQKAKKMFGDSNKKEKDKFGKTDKNADDEDMDQELDEPSKKSYQFIPHLKDIVNNLVSSFVHGDSLNESEVQNSDEMIKCEKQVEFVTKHLEQIETCQVKTEILELSNRIKSICTRLKDMKGNISDIDPTEAGDLAEAMIDIQYDMAQIYLRSQSAMNSCPRGRPPNMKSCQSSDGNAGAVSSAINKANMKAEGSLMILQNTQDKYAKSSDNLTHASERMCTILAEMAKLDMEKLNFQQIIDVLHTGLKALGDITEQWDKIVRFFQTITNIIDCSLDVSLKNFLDISKAKSPALEGYNLAHLKRDLLHRKVIHISEIAGFVTLVAESYLEVSQNHVMPRLDGLHKLLCYHPQKDKIAIRQKQLSLQTECTDAQRKITDLIEKKRRKYHRVMKRRISSMQREMSRGILRTVPSAKRAQKADPSEFCSDDFV